MTSMPEPARPGSCEDNLGQEGWSKPFSAALLANNVCPPAHTGKRGLPDAKRFSVYRNNIHHALLEALAATFPSTRAILGEGRFRDTAIAFLRQHPPGNAVMASYGGEFPGFVGSLPQFSSAPFLADLTRLEYAWLEAYHACDASPLTPDALLMVNEGDADGLRFTAHPATRLITSEHAIFDLFSARDAWPLKLDDPHGFSTDMSQSVLITRPGLEVVVQKLPASAARFIAALMARQPLAEAIAAGAGEDGDFDAGTCIAMCLERGAFSACHLNNEHERAPSQSGK